MTADQRIEYIAATIAVAELVRRHMAWGDLLEPQKDEYRRLARECLRAIDSTADWEYRFAEIHDDGTMYTYGPQGHPDWSFATVEDARKHCIEESDVIVRRRKAPAWELM